MRVTRNQPEVMSLLLSSGAQVNALNKSACSTLHVAVNKQHAGCVVLLLNHPTCDVNLQACIMHLVHSLDNQ